MVGLLEQNNSVFWNDIPFNNFVLLPSKQAADVFLSDVYPFCSSSLIITADSSYPTDPFIKEMSLKKLANDESPRVVVIGAYILNEIKVKTKKKLILDSLLIDQLDSFKFSGVEITPTFLGFLIESFFAQDKYEMLKADIYDSEWASFFVDEDNYWVQQLLSPTNTPPQKSRPR
jgi:hypothetical protein